MIYYILYINLQDNISLWTSSNKVSEFFLRYLLCYNRKQIIKVLTDIQHNVEFICS